MKRLNKKLLGIGLIVLFFSTAIVFLVKAQVITPEQFFRVNSASTTPTDATMPSTSSGMPERSIVIINRSNKDYFVPRKKLEEFSSFVYNAPRYISVAIDKDLVCSEGESPLTNPVDCKETFWPAGAPPEGCGDGICKNSIVRVSTISAANPNGILKPASWTVCDPDQAGFIAVGIWNTIIGTITGCAIGGPVGCFVGAVISVIPSAALVNASKCTTVNGQTYITEIEAPAGEVYEKTEYGQELQVVCKADCAATIEDKDCGVCGFANGNLCRNWCAGGGFHMENCGYYCDFDGDTSKLCPAGSFCQAITATRFRDLILLLRSTKASGLRPSNNSHDWLVLPRRQGYAPHAFRMICSLNNDIFATPYAKMQY